MNQSELITKPYYAWMQSTGHILTPAKKAELLQKNHRTKAFNQPISNLLIDQFFIHSDDMALYFSNKNKNNDINLAKSYRVLLSHNLSVAGIAKQDVTALKYHFFVLKIWWNKTYEVFQNGLYLGKRFGYQILNFNGVFQKHMITKNRYDYSKQLASPIANEPKDFHHYHQIAEQIRIENQQSYEKTKSLRLTNSNYHHQQNNNYSPSSNLNSQPSVHNEAKSYDYDFDYQETTENCDVELDLNQLFE